VYRAAWRSSSHSVTRAPVKFLIPAMKSRSKPTPRIVSPPTIPMYLAIRCPSIPRVVTPTMGGAEDGGSSFEAMGARSDAGRDEVSSGMPPITRC